ncbi:MAG TPA: sigma factor, partial [Bryobacteraceae bacterium]|nr:sigma factor [Bryobacteraceae bacterium]
MVLQDTEKELIERCQRAEPDAFRALFEKYKDMVYSVALRYSGDPSVAQDIAQDTFLKLFSTIGSFR